MSGPYPCGEGAILEAFQQLEQDWAKWNDLDPAGMVACSSGTAALHLALESLQLTPGSMVIVPDLTMIACPRAVTMAGLEPVFVDCDETLNIDPTLLEGSTTADRALLAVHVYGRQCDMEKIGWYCKVDAGGPITKPIRFIEDLAEAHGIRPNRYTDAACWSFYKNKIVAGEEGGAVWFKDREYARLARQLRSLGFTDAHDFNHIPRGINARMSNAHAKLVLSSLNDYNYNKVDRDVQVERLDITCPREWRMPERQAQWVYDLHVPGMTSVQQNAVVKALNDIDIAARHCFKPCSRQLEYVNTKMICGDNINGTKSSVAAREVIYLPLTPGRPRIDGVVFGVIQSTLAQNGYRS